ncbi:IclR family transcriptional regulator [Humitalea sp. 24SJ18S-53]|uniref:IclR family transcriptional regulator n=1 Tax=Humitalea sp. 24SJ18S-53 TaxID=3422307 RepID=UPI003D67F714
MTAPIDRQKLIPGVPAENHESYLVPGLERGLRVLEVLAAAERGLTVRELAQRIGIGRSSAFRLVYTLRFMGFLEGSPDERVYRLGPRVLNLGFAYLNGQSLIQVAQGVLEALRDATGVSAHLAIRDRRDVLFLDCVQSRSGYLTTFNTGTRLPASVMPMGWLLLSDMSAREMADLYRDGALPARTPDSPADLATLMRNVAQAAALGHVVSRGMVDRGGSSVAAPVFDQSGHVVAAIDISGPDVAFRFDEMDSFYVPEVLKAARAISERLGYFPAA